MLWTDRIRQVKIVLVIAAIAIVVASLVMSHLLVRDLQQEERKKMETWAEALNMLNNADETTDLSLVLTVMQGNTTIPVVVMNADGQVTDYRNVEIAAKSAADSIAAVTALGQRLQQKGNYIKVDIGDPATSRDYQLVCYDESILLRRLSQYPYWQLGIVMVFVLVALYALLSAKRAEQNKVWVGLSKETAHQLGTPISSLMAWVEILKENYPGDELIPEMSRDVKRLELVAERFSKIGSLPELTDCAVNDVLTHVADYMSQRTSKRVAISLHQPEHPVTARMNAALFEWVVENLCKNAVDAMKGEGRIDLTLTEERGKVVVEVADTGRGIRRKDLDSVFKPGFTTKPRGWGLGLSLARRIVEDYHRGRIFVKSSEVDVGTVFRIELHKRGESV